MVHRGGSCHDLVVVGCPILDGDPVVVGGPPSGADPAVACGHPSEVDPVVAGGREEVPSRRPISRKAMCPGPSGDSG